MTFTIVTELQAHPLSQLIPATQPIPATWGEFVRTHWPKTVEQIRNFLQGFRAKVSSVSVSQTAEYIALMLELWLPSRPSDFIVDDQNLMTLLEHCLTSHHGYVDAMWLGVTCREAYDYLRHHVPPQPAPVIAEPAPPPPKKRDSLGDGAASTEAGIPVVQTESRDSTALQDGVNYAWGNETMKSRLDKAWQECRNQSFENGYMNHAKARTLFEQRRKTIEAEFAAEASHRPEGT